MTSTLQKPAMIKLVDKYPQVCQQLEDLKTARVVKITKTLAAKVPKMHIQFCGTNEGQREQMIAIKAQIPEADWTGEAYGEKFSVPIMVEEGRRPDLKEILMQLSDAVLAEDNHEPSSKVWCLEILDQLKDNNTSIIVLFSMWMNKNEAARRQLDKLGFDWRM